MLNFFLLKQAVIFLNIYICKIVFLFGTEVQIICLFPRSLSVI